MRSSVVIKSSKAGMTVILDSQIPFQELLEAIGKKFRGKRQVLGRRPDDPHFGGQGAYGKRRIADC